MRDQINYLATLLALVLCFITVLLAASLHPELIDKMTALGVGVVFGGLLGALNNTTAKPKLPTEN